MKMKIRTTLFAGAIAALIAGPLWATGETPREGASATPATQPMSATPRLGGSYVGSTARTSTSDNPLYARSADDLDGMEVVDRVGDKVGDITQIVLAPDRKSAHAVISVGGILGMGARDIMISLNDLTPIGDKLQMSATKAEATAETEADPDADKYVEVEGDTPISGSIVEFSAFEQDKDATRPGASPSTPNLEGARLETSPSADMDRAKPAIAPETPRAPQ